MAKPKQTRPMIPTIFFYNAEGKKCYVYGRFELETIVNAIYKDVTEVQVGKHSVSILKQVWEVEVSDVMGEV